MPADVYDPVTKRPDDTRFDTAMSPDIAVKRAMTGHILVRPKVDGQEIGWFIFDTGAAATMIDAAAAEKLKLEAAGDGRGHQRSRKRTKLVPPGGLDSRSVRSPSPSPIS